MLSPSTYSVCVAPDYVAAQNIAAGVPVNVPMVAPVLGNILVLVYAI